MRQEPLFGDCAGCGIHNPLDNQNLCSVCATSNPE